MKNILILSLSILLSAIVPAAGFDQGRTNKLMAEHRKQALDLDVIAEQSTLASPEKIPLEIERKFLIDQNSIPQNFLKQAERFEITQTYISYDPEIRLRRVDQAGFRGYYFTMKLPKDSVGLSRSEMEFEIYQDVYQNLVKKRVGATIQKTRLQVAENGHTICVDLYRDATLTGLSVAEVEFDSTDEAAAFVPPKWFGQDVTADKRFKNANLAKNGKPDSH